MLVKMLYIDIDPEEYPIPADGKVSEEIEMAFVNIFMMFRVLKLKI